MAEQPLPLQGLNVTTEACPAAMRRRDSWNIHQFHILKKLGQGYASTVCLGTCSTSGVQCAIKMYVRAKLSELNYFQIMREIRIHSQLDHTNILQLWAAFEDVHGVYLVSEYAARGDVFSDVERRGGKLTEAEAANQIMYPFLCALQYLHGNNIIHRDIKPENLLLNAMGVLKVADFGLSINCSQERPVTRVGTLDYMSPEVLVCPDKTHPMEHKDQAHLAYTTLVDAWAVGVLAYELLVGRAPFDKGNKRATVQEIMQADVQIPDGVMSDQAQAFIQAALIKDPRRRPGVEELQEHAWIQQHLASQQKPRRILRVDSFHGRSQFMQGMLQGFGPDSDDSDAPPPVISDEVARTVQLQSNQPHRMLASAQSMTGLEFMHYRDVRISSLRPNSGGAPRDSAVSAGSGASAPGAGASSGSVGSGASAPVAGSKRPAPALSARPSADYNAVHSPTSSPPPLKQHLVQGEDGQYMHRQHVTLQQHDSMSSALQHLRVGSGRKTVSFAVTGVPGVTPLPHPPPEAPQPTPIPRSPRPLARSRSCNMSEAARQCPASPRTGNPALPPGLVPLPPSNAVQIGACSSFTPGCVPARAMIKATMSTTDVLKGGPAQVSPQRSMSPATRSITDSGCAPNGGVLERTSSCRASPSRSFHRSATLHSVGGTPLLPSCGAALVPTRLGSQSGAAVPSPQPHSGQYLVLDSNPPTGSLSYQAQPDADPADRYRQAPFMSQRKRSLGGNPMPVAPLPGRLSTPRKPSVS